MTIPARDAGHTSAEPVRLYQMAFDKAWVGMWGFILSFWATSALLAGNGGEFAAVLFIAWAMTGWGMAAHAADEAFALGAETLAAWGRSNERWFEGNMELIRKLEQYESQPYRDEEEWRS